MLTIDEAFAKFRGRQELRSREQADVSRRHTDVRTEVRSGVKTDRDFLTGSYDRWTKTRPLKDVDVFFVLHEDERAYRHKHPREILRRKTITMRFRTRPTAHGSKRILRRMHNSPSTRTRLMRASGSRSSG